MTPLAQTLESAAQSAVSVMLPGLTAALTTALGPAGVAVGPVLAVVEQELGAYMPQILGALMPQAPVPTAQQTSDLNDALAALEAAIAAKTKPAA